MIKTKKLSVIIPVYNAAALLRKCLDSVCNQTLADYEVICVDDCSTDNSFQILCDCSEIYHNLIVLQQPANMGAGPARNAGLDKAVGEYIAFMDADDFYPNLNTLEMLYCAAKEHQALICGGGVLFKRGEELTPGKDSHASYIFQQEGWVEYKDCQQFYYYQRFIYNREMLEKNHIHFPAYLRFQDPPFFVKAMLAAERFYVIKEPVYIYLSDSAHVKWNDKKVNDMLSGVMDVIRMCLDYRLDQMYYKFLERYLKNRYVMGILEDSFIKGNDNVAVFYKELFDTLDRDLLGDNFDKLDFAYAEKIANARLKRNMTYQHCSLELADADELPSRAPKVSVIIPVYNTSPYVGLCMDSILGQTLSEIEVICIDDGSTDGSGEILDMYARKYSHVRVFHQDNAGLSAARNAGVRRAHGKYLYFMDSDDFLARTALEELWQHAERENLDIIYFAAESFYENNETRQNASKFFETAYKRNGMYSGAMSGKDMLCQQCKEKDYYTSVPLQFFKTAFIRENQLGFYEGLLHEDNLFTLTAIIKAQRTMCIDSVYFYRRVRASSIMTASMDYRNVLGFYLSAVEGMKLLTDTSLQANDSAIIRNKLNEFCLNHVSSKWLALSAADQVLFRASLTETDRALFDTFVMPMISLRSQLQKIPKSQVDAGCQLQKLKEENKKLKNDFKTMKKTMVNKSSRSYQLGRWITYIPRQIRLFVRKIVR